MRGAYVGTEDGELFCIELATGKQRWRFKHPSISSGIRRAVAVANDTVVFASRGKALLGVNTGTGKIRWQFSAKSKFDSSPVIVDCHAVIGATDGRLYVIDIATGQERFVYELGDSIVGSVVPTSRRLIVATANGQVQCLGDTSRPTRELAATTNDKVNSTIIDDRNFGEIQIESAGAEQLQVRSQMQGNTPEILIEGRSRLIITARGLTHIGEADALVVRGWKPGATDWSKAVFLFKGNVIWKTAGDRFMPREGVSEIHADSMRYEAATMRGSLIGVGNNAWIIRSNGSKQRIATQPAPEPIWRSAD